MSISRKTWMPGTRPGMTMGEACAELFPSLRGAKRRSNPARICCKSDLDCFAALAMTTWVLMRLAMTHET
jgi:hypothetical protein